MDIKKMILNFFGFILHKICRYSFIPIWIIVFMLIICPLSDLEAMAQTSAPGSVVQYTVRPGDTLWRIAQNHNTGVAEIMALNQLPSAALSVGQILRIPEGRHIPYGVRRGDTLGLLAENFGTTVSTIQGLNGLSGTMIYQGQILLIPANYMDYPVKTGDTLWSIANRFGTTVWRIQLFNNLTGAFLSVGQILRIPAIPQAPQVTYVTHVVQSGDTPWAISLRYGIPNEELLRINGLTAATGLTLGQRLTIPVYSIPVKPTPGPQYGEYVDWWTEAQYLFPTGKTATIVDFSTGRRFTVRRTIGAFHADCEPMTATDTETIRALWGGSFSWSTRPVIVTVDGRRMAASMSSTPHGIQYIENNHFNGHFDIHFLNSTRHKDGAIDAAHQSKVRIAAGRS